MKASPRFEQLYQYGRISAENQKLIRELSKESNGKYSFKPKIKEYDCEKTRQGFFERQEQDCREREYKLQRSQEVNSTASIRRGMMPRVNSAPHKRVYNSII